MRLRISKILTITMLLFSFVLIIIGIYLLKPKTNTILKSHTQSIDDIVRSDTNIKVDNTDAITSTNNVENNPVENNNEILYSQKDTSLSIEQSNDRFRSKLETTYDVVIRYGEEIADYEIGDMSTTPITDPYKIESILNELANILSKYPNGFFREFSKKNMYLSIYLIDTYSVQDVTGVTDPRTNNVVISIATAYPLSESFYHESFHYMEKYIQENGGTFNSWKGFNPIDFNYGNTNTNYSYINTLNTNSYFVNDYAQTSDDEDRASTFEYMMADYKISCFSPNTTIMNKSKYLADVIDLFFTTVNSNTIEYWERYL